MNRLNFIKTIALTAISSTIFGNSIKVLSHKTDLIIPNVCHNGSFDIDFNKHNVVISGKNKTHVDWKGCSFNLKNIPDGRSPKYVIYDNFTEGNVFDCAFTYKNETVKYYHTIYPNISKKFTN